MRLLEVARLHPLAELGREITPTMDDAIAIITRQLGHASITTTARYLDHLAPRAVIQAMRGRGWTRV